MRKKDKQEQQTASNKVHDDRGNLVREDMRWWRVERYET